MRKTEGRATLQNMAMEFFLRDGKKQWLQKSSILMKTEGL
jgi:hypothetical protein